MRLKHYVLILLFGQAIQGYSQSSFGVSTGIFHSDITSPIRFSNPNSIQYQSKYNADIRLFFSVYYDVLLFSKSHKLRQELVLYTIYHSYDVLIPPTNFNVVTSESFTTVNYRGVLSIISFKNLNLYFGPSFDFNIKKASTDNTNYASTYPEGAEFVRALKDAYKPITLFADAEIELRIKRFKITLNYKVGLTSPTGSFDFMGVQQEEKSNSQQFFLRLGYDLWTWDNTN